MVQISFIVVLHAEKIKRVTLLVFNSGSRSPYVCRVSAMSCTVSGPRVVRMRKARSAFGKGGSSEAEDAKPSRCCFGRRVFRPSRAGVTMS